uniref:Uncharacterized protein n=1 Tax=Sphaerodactylus townsendi TaxID=933632 RepID=A0ACB8GC10_9SAUR
MKRAAAGPAVPRAARCQGRCSRRHSSAAAELRPVRAVAALRFPGGELAAWQRQQLERSLSAGMAENAGRSMLSQPGRPARRTAASMEDEDAKAHNLRYSCAAVSPAAMPVMSSHWVHGSPLSTRHP